MELKPIHQQTEEELNINYKGRYNAYLKTKHWQATRGFMLKKNNGKCEACGSSEKINVHHLTYERFGAETEDDLMCLCNKCHKAVHSKMLFERLGTKKDIVKTYKKFKRINKKLDNVGYMQCLPLIGNGWEIEELSQAWCMTEEEATKRIEEFAKIGLVNKQKRSDNEYFYVVNTSIFTWLSYEFPKITKKKVV